MHIALIRKDYDDRHGGAERYCTALARGLADRGHSVHLFAGRHQIESHPHITLHAVPYITAPSSLKNVSFQYSAKKKVRQYRFDIINGLSQVYPQDVYRLGDGLHRHWLRVQTPHFFLRLLKENLPRHRVILEIEKKIISDAGLRRIVVNSHMCADQLQLYYGFSADKTSLIYNGVDLSRFNTGSRAKNRHMIRSRLGVSEADTMLLFAGHNFTRKGLSHAVSCCAALRERGIPAQLIAAGRGRTEPVLRHAHRWGIRKHVKLLGPVENMLPLYHAADLLIHPALYDPCSNVCLEAMACALPVLTTRSNGASELIEPDKTGILVDRAGDSTAMAESAARHIESSAHSLKLMGEAAAEAMHRHSIQHNIDRTLAVYREVCSEKGIT